MPSFLRDKQITNTSINEDIIKQLSEFFEVQKSKLSATLSYTIRFDEKGYKVNSQNELLKYFKQAKKIDRVILSLDTNDSINSKRNSGAFMDLRLEKETQNLSVLIVASDDETWVNSSFFSIQEIIRQGKNKNRLIRSRWFELLLQVIGIVLVFFFSLLAANNFSKKLLIANSFFIVFFALLVFSNIWSCFNKILILKIHGYFSNLKFYRVEKDKISWIMNTVITAIIGAGILASIGFLFSHAVSILNSFLIQGK